MRPRAQRKRSPVEAASSASHMRMRLSVDTARRAWRLASSQPLAVKFSTCSMQVSWSHIRAAHASPAMTLLAIMEG